MWVAPTDWCLIISDEQVIELALKDFGEWVFAHQSEVKILTSKYSRRSISM